MAVSNGTFNLTVTVVIFLVGGILGIGAGTFFIYPNMVESNIGEINQQISDLTTQVDDATVKLEKIESILGSSSENIINIQSNIDTIYSNINQIKTRLSEVETRISSVQDSIESAENVELIDIVSKLESLIYRMDSTEAYRIMRKNLAKPGQYIVDSIVDEIIAEMQMSDNNLVRGAGQLVGVTKPIIKAIINSKTPSIYWYGYGTTRLNENRYETHMKTYYHALHFNVPGVGDIGFARIGIILKCEVNLSTSTVVPDSIEVHSVELELS